jgi:hypothetical protein
LLEPDLQTRRPHRTAKEASEPKTQYSAAEVEIDARSGFRLKREESRILKDGVECCKSSVEVDSSELIGRSLR